MDGAVTIAGGFAEVGAGAWLMSHAQPAAFFGTTVRHRRKGWVVRDRGLLDLVETSAAAKCADSARPFLTYIPCAAPVFAVSGKVLVAPAQARCGAQFIKTIPMSMRSAICVTEFDLADGKRETEDGQPTELPETQPPSCPAWVVMATASRTARIPVADGETLSARPESVVAWTGNLPTGFCPRLGLMDILLPRGPRDLLLHFHGPCIVWIEGANDSRLAARVSRQFSGRAV